MSTSTLSKKVDFCIHVNPEADLAYRDEKARRELGCCNIAARHLAERTMEVFEAVRQEAIIIFIRGGSIATRDLLLDTTLAKGQRELADLISDSGQVLL